jgi:small subunit ribosomal protein S2
VANQEEDKMEDIQAQSAAEIRDAQAKQEGSTSSASGLSDSSPGGSWESDALERAREATKKAIEQGSILPGAFASTSQSLIASRPNILGKVTDGKSLAGKALMNTVEARPPVEVNLRTLLEAGAHFGHQTARWNPAMAPYIYGSRNGIHIINLPKTVQAWSRAKAAIQEMAAQGGTFLFVGTKKQAQAPVALEATRCKSFFVAERWLGGMLTNFSTVRRSVDRMKKLEETLREEEMRINSGASPKFTKKERLMFSRELEKLTASLGGIKEMTALPSMLFVIDIRREEIAVKEAQRLDIPVVALVDTNCDPAVVTYAIPSNDDGTRAITLFAEAVADAVMEGRKRYVPQKVEESAREDRRGRAPATTRRGRQEEPAPAEVVATPQPVAEA